MGPRPVTIGPVPGVSGHTKGICQCPGDPCGMPQGLLTPSVLNLRRPRGAIWGAMEVTCASRRGRAL
eukprot:15453134-Alexandrium_andersonii.AAC.1